MKAIANKRDISKALKNLTEDEIYTMNDLNLFVRDYYCSRLFVKREDVENYVMNKVNQMTEDWLNCVVINHIRYFWIDYKILTDNRTRCEQCKAMKKILVNGVLQRI